MPMTRSSFAASSRRGCAALRPGSTELQARIVGAGRGLRWLAEGWRLFRAAPLGWLALVFAYWLMMTLVSLAPYVGVAAASGLVPAFSVGFMAAGGAPSHPGGGPPRR